MTQTPALADITMSSRSAKLVVRRLVLDHFRSFARLNVEVGPEPVVLTGENGAGKTNLLEALSLLAPGRGLRRARLADFSKREPEPHGWAVAATLSGCNGCINIGTGHIGGTPGRRKIRINGVDGAVQSTLSEYLHVIWITPGMDRLFTDAPSARRRFFDHMVTGFDPEHGRRLLAYQRCMRERVQMLRAYHADDVWLSAIEETIAEHAVAIAAARCDALTCLNNFLDSSFSEWFPRASIAFEGTVECGLKYTPAVTVEEQFRSELAKSRTRDRETGAAAFGPHRTELLVWHIDHDLPAAHCSTGEQKMLLISIVLAHALAQVQRSGQTPLILLDEAMAHLDAIRRGHLIDALCMLGAQTWLTGVDADLFSYFASRAQFLTVSDGDLKKCDGRKLKQ